MTAVDPSVLLGAALNALVEPVLVTDASGLLTFVNTAAMHAFGADKDVGQPVVAFLERFPARRADGQPMPAALHPVRRAQAQAEAVIGAELTLTIEGEPAVYVVNAVPLRGVSGMTGVLATFHDVTGARRLEREAAEHAARLETLVDLVDEGVFIIDVDDTLLFANGRGREILADMPSGERPADRARRLDMRDAQGVPLGAERLPSFRALHGETVTDMPLLVRARRGEQRTWRVSAHPLRREGVIYAAVVTWRDVTDEARALGALEAARAAAEDASRMKDDFIAALSHELRTPLQPILGWTDVLRRHGALDDVTGRALDVVHRNIRHQVRLVDDLLDLSRIAHGKFALRFETFDVREQVQAAVDAFEESAAAKRVRLSTALAAEPIAMWGDAARVHQIVNNLLANALKFTPAGGEVRVRLQARDARAVLEIEDSGEGIAAADLSIIFEPFRQGRQSSRRGGLGIGLDLVRRLTELHGGHVTVASAGLGQGACFRVELPLTVVDAAPSGTNDAATPRLQGQSVLVIEDNDDTREVLKFMLETEGARVETAGWGEEGVRAAERLRPTVVLCDIGLPDIDGLEVARRLQERGNLEGTRLIALTGYGQADDVRHAVEAGFEAHLTKPVNLEQLLALLTPAPR
jgi:signal transduction histidine kinase